MCEHIFFKRELQSRAFLGETFTFLAEVCQECGFVLWDKEVSENFVDWFSKREISSDRLSMKFSLNKIPYEFLLQMVARFPGIDRSDVIRALVSVYMDVVLKDPVLNESVERVTRGDIFKSFSAFEQEKKLIGIRFKPFALLDISDWARIAGLPNVRFVEEAVLRMVAICIETDKDLKKLWEERLKPSVETILKAA